jgi:branched-chain amino acid transport system permease protein
MSSLGYNVRLHRTVAFGFAGFVAALGGILFAWWNQHIDPASIQLSAVIDVLVIAVIGGLYRIEAAWLGAFVWVVLNNYVQRIGFWSLSTRFETVIGLVFLVIVLLSPRGLIGIWERVVAFADPRRDRSSASAQSPLDAGTVEPSV